MFMWCSTHPDVRAADRCAACAEAFCTNCLVEIQGRKYCGSCKVITVQAPPVLEMPNGMEYPLLAPQASDWTATYSTRASQPVAFGPTAGQLAASPARPAVPPPFILPAAAAGSDASGAQADKAVIQCVHCGRRYRINRSGIGKQARCGCGEVFEIKPCDEVIPPASEGAGNVPAAVPAGFAPASGPLGPAYSAFAPAYSAFAPTYPGFAPPLGAPGWSVAPLGTRCRRHQEVQAAHFCANCRAPVCGTCDFIFPGCVHLCPACATAPPRKSLGRRRARVIWSLVLGGSAVLVMVIMMLLASQMGMSQETLATAGGMSCISLVASLVGMGLGVSCINRRLGNPPIVWVAAGVNVFIIAVWVMCFFAGALRGG